MKLTIIGASGHGKVVADIARLNGYDDIQFLDDNPEAKYCNGYPVVGKTDLQIIGDCFVAIGNSKIREKLMNGRKTITLVHPNAVVAEGVEIGEGSVVMAGAVINSEAKIGRGVIVNTSSSIDHDCIIGDFVHVSVGAHLCGSVSVGNHTWIGAGGVVSNNLNICDLCMVGAGAIVINNLEQSGTYIGVPAILK